MRACYESICGLLAGVCPTMADIAVTADGAESWLKVGGLAALVFIMGRQLVLSWQRNSELVKQMQEKCDHCQLMKAAKERITGDYSGHVPPEKGRFQ
ncbi:MAG: hypothetical protein MJ074_06380 [Oscillospiraceae bacterium]|nr:hypothetical protein [Oscillospiraceae bacterium]